MPRLAPIAAVVLSLWLGAAAAQKTGAEGPTNKPPAAASAATSGTGPQASGPAATLTPLPPIDPSLGGASPADEGLDLMGQLIRTILSLGVVVALIYVAARFGLQRLMGLRGLGGPNRDLKMVERLALDPRHALYVVTYKQERTFLLGSGEGGLRLIGELGPGAIETTPGAKKSFAALLDREKSADSAPENRGDAARGPQ